MKQPKITLNSRRFYTSSMKKIVVSSFFVTIPSVLPEHLPGGRLSYIDTCVPGCANAAAHRPKEEEKKKERLPSDLPQQQTSSRETAEHAMYCRFSSVDEQDIATLPTLFSQLLEHRSHPIALSDPKLLELQDILRHQVNRKRFLIMLTLSPHLAAHYLLEDLASLLEVSPILLVKYLNTANSVLAQKRACKQEFETISHRHFRRLLEIESELLREEDEEKRLKLERLRIWNQRVYKAKIKQIRTMELNLSHSELGNCWNPKGTIDSSVLHEASAFEVYGRTRGQCGIFRPGHSAQ